MANNIEITAIKLNLDENAKKYAEKKIHNLYKYLPRHAAKSASFKLTLERLSKKRDDTYQAEIILSVPDKTLTASANATNVTAAVDLVEPKILSQIRRYKTETMPQLGVKRGVLRKVKERFFRDHSE